MHSLKILPPSPPLPRCPVIVVRHIRLWFLAAPAAPYSGPSASQSAAVPAPCAPLSWFLCYGWCEKRSAVFCWGSLKPLLLRCC